MNDTFPARKEPTGLLRDPVTKAIRRLSKSKMAVIEAKIGQTLASFLVGKECDVTAFEP